MSRLRITGRENIAARAEFYLPNRIDEPTLAELDKQLGGADKLAFMVEEVLLPDERVMRYIRSGNRRVLSFNFRREATCATCAKNSSTSCARATASSSSPDAP